MSGRSIEAVQGQVKGVKYVFLLVWWVGRWSGCQVKSLESPKSNPPAVPSSAPEYVHVVPCPDSYRGIHTGPDAGQKYGESVR